MKIAISSGHGKYVEGAIGFINEHDEAVRVVNRVADFLDDADVPVVTFEDTTSHSQDENLDTIIDWHNDQDRDLDVSVHFNFYDGNAHGTEVWYVTQDSLATTVSQAISNAGEFTNRGPKSNGLAFLNQTDEPAILIEVCFCDNAGDCENYRQRFDAICRAIAESITGTEMGDVPPDHAPPEPDRPGFPNWSGRPESIPVEDRPTLRQGDEGPHVLDMQRMIPRFSGPFDGDWGDNTQENVLRYQRSRALEPDGICGPQTWQALYDHKLPEMPSLPPGSLTAQQQATIMRIANDSAIADYSWDDRGVAPTGFTQGMALSFGQTYKKLKAGHAAATEMAKARTNSDKDVLDVYRSDFDRMGMSNEEAGADTLRHLYAFMLGSGMRESSGQHCCGRDQSADNVQAETCEAGAFQTSYNANGASQPEFGALMDEYALGLSPGFLEAFSEGVSCSTSDWENYGSGVGAQFQAMCKEVPAFSAETHALTLRNLCNHYGPVIRHEVELRAEADHMFRAVQSYVDESEPAVA